MRRAVRAGSLAAASLLVAGAPTASAHVQVTPSRAATDDGVLFTALVPNERDSATTSVEIQIPKGMLAYGFEDPPGWTHKTVLAADQSIGSVRWTGKIAVGDFARFSLLASTPEAPTTIAWKALQTYADGKVVRWIGAPDSESPASRTVIDAAAPKQGAGGEVATPEDPGTAGSGSGSGSADGGSITAAPAQSDGGSSGDGGPDWVARGLSGGALVAALAALGLAITGRRHAPTKELA